MRKLVLSLFLIPCCGFADPQSEILDKKLREMRRSQTGAQVEAGAELLNRIRDLRGVCEAQLDGDKIPAACFTVLADEVRAGLINAKVLAAQETWLSSVCIRRAKSAAQIADLQMSREEDLPPKCQETLRVRREDLRYALETENPSHLFRNRDPKCAECTDLAKPGQDESKRATREGRDLQNHRRRGKWSHRIGLQGGSFRR